MDLHVPKVVEVHRQLLSLQTNLECPICLEVMKEPVSTNCGHIFCRFCILKLLTHKKRATLCPFCEAEVTERSLRDDICLKGVIKEILDIKHAFERDTGLKVSDDFCYPLSTCQEKLIIDSEGYRNRSKRMKKEEKRNTKSKGDDSNLPQYNGNETRYFLRKERKSGKTMVLEIDKEHRSVSSEDIFQEENIVKCMELESPSSSQVDKDCIMNQSQSSCHIEHPESSAKNEPSLNIGEEMMSYASEATTLEDSLGQFSQSEILTTQQRDAMQNNLKQLQKKMAIIEAVLKEGSQSVGSEGGSPEREENDFKREQTETRKEMPSVLEKSVSPLAHTTCCRTKKRKNNGLLLTEGQKMSLVASGLNQSELKLVHKFAKKTKSTWCNKITERTTHLIMKTDEDLVCKRTLKYFIGIAAQKWVLSYQWIIQSFETGRVLKEEDFEVRGDVASGRNHQGPKRARKSPAGKLFQGMEICCYGPFTDMLSEHLEWIVELCGATLVKQPHLFAHATDDTAVIVIQPDAWTEETTCQKLPLQGSIAVVSREWVLDSVGCYQCQPLDYYIIPKELSSMSE